MSIDLISAEPVTIDQLIEAGKRCSIDIESSSKDIYDEKVKKYCYTMTWDLDDYENYANNILSEPTSTDFREMITPVNGRFVMEMDFYLGGSGHFSCSCSTRHDDMGIASRLLDEVGIELISLDEWHYRSEIGNNPCLTNDIESFKETNPKFYEFITQSGGLTIEHYVERYSSKKGIAVEDSTNMDDVITFAYEDDAETHRRVEEWDKQFECTRNELATELGCSVDEVTIRKVLDLLYDKPQEEGEVA